VFGERSRAERWARYRSAGLTSSPSSSSTVQETASLTGMITRWVFTIALPG
jgi:hypothetical protein